MVFSEKFIRWTLPLMALLLLGTVANAHSGDRGAKPAIGANAGDACVRPTDWMRRNHMELLKHDRDLTLRQGVRPVDGSIKGCVDCHANQDGDGRYIPVNAEEQFCASCHNYTAVKLDCFECHATRPETTAVSREGSAQ